MRLVPLQDQITSAGLEELSIRIHRWFLLGRASAQTQSVPSSEPISRRLPQHRVLAAAEDCPCQGCRDPVWDVAATKRPRESLSGCLTHKKRVANGVSPWGGSPYWKFLQSILSWTEPWRGAKKLHRPE